MPSIGALFKCLYYNGAVSLWPMQSGKGEDIGPQMRWDYC